MTEKLIDMHTHTNLSDGELSPEELIEYAKKHNIETLSITDHDTLQGIKSVDLSRNHGLCLIPGIELSAKVNKGRMHILGYNINVNNEKLNKKMNELSNDSLYSIISYLNDLAQTYNIHFSNEDIINLINTKRNLGRPDIAKLLLKYGYVNYIQEAFDKYLIDIFNRVRGKNKGINYEECISLIKESGGYAVLAHPHSLELNDKELLKMIRNLISCGLDGIEVYHSNHTPEQMKQYLQIAKQENLLISGGSDFHGKSVKPNVEIGIGKDNLHIKSLSLLDKIKS